MNYPEKFRLISSYCGYGHSYRLDCDLNGDLVKNPYSFDHINLHHIIRNELNVKLILRPLVSMTPAECLSLCKISVPDLFGDYRFDKWKAELDEKSNDTWTAYDVTRKKGEMSFVVDLIDGDITVYEGDKDVVDAWTKSFYRGWYYQHGFDIPTYPTGKTLKELDLAIYK